MSSITAFIMSIITTLSLLFGTLGSADYVRQTGLKEAIEASVNRDKITSTSYIGKADGEAWFPEKEYRIEDHVILKKEKDKDFVILNLADVHFSDYDYRAWYAFEGTATIRRLVASVKPDLITVSGDIVCGASSKYSIARFTDLMESFGIPWAPIFGNHDKEANCDVNYLADVMMKSPHCVMQKGDPSMGTGNYIINICEDNDGEPVPVESLIMYYCRTPDAKKLMDWYAWAADGINKASGGKAETVVFSHIPIPEYIYAYNEAWDSENNRWKDGYKAYGELHEKICIDYDADGKPVLEGFFDVMKEHGTKYFFCSHDHMNDFSLEYNGIRLTYMMKLGYGSGFQIGFNGGTVIRIDKGIERITHKTVSTGIMKDIVDINTKA